MGKSEREGEPETGERVFRDREGPKVIKEAVNSIRNKDIDKSQLIKYLMAFTAVGVIMTVIWRGLKKLQIENTEDGETIVTIEEDSP